MVRGSIAERSGYLLNWERFSQSPAGRDILYIARDRSVNELALPHIRHEATRRSIVLSMDQVEGNQDLPGLLQDVIQPVGEPSLEQQLAAEEGRAVAVPNEPADAFEQSLEDQLRGQESGGYQVKVAAKANADSQRQDHPQEDSYDVPGMNI
jgi:cell filamentation protein